MWKVAFRASAMVKTWLPEKAASKKAIPKHQARTLAPLKPFCSPRPRSM